MRVLRRFHPPSSGTDVIFLRATASPPAHSQAGHRLGMRRPSRESVTNLSPPRSSALFVSRRSWPQSSTPHPRPPSPLQGTATWCSPNTRPCSPSTACGPPGSRAAHRPRRGHPNPPSPPTGRRTNPPLPPLASPTAIPPPVYHRSANPPYPPPPPTGGHRSGPETSSPSGGGLGPYHATVAAVLEEIQKPVSSKSTNLPIQAPATGQAGWHRSSAPDPRWAHPSALAFALALNTTQGGVSFLFLFTMIMLSPISPRLWLPESREAIRSQKNRTRVPFPPALPVSPSPPPHSAGAWVRGLPGPGLLQDQQLPRVPGDRSGPSRRRTPCSHPVPPPPRNPH